MECGEGRNCTVFNDLRQLCYREASHYFGNERAFSSRVLTLAFAMNQQFAFPLSPREIAAIARSVTKWISKRFSADAFSKIQRCRADPDTRPMVQISDTRTKTIPTVAMFQTRERTKNTPAA